MSSRGIRDEQSIESLGIDLEAVVEAAGLDRFVLLARWHGCHIAVRYVINHPERVVALILIVCAEKNTAWPTSVYQMLPQQNWDLFLLTQAVRNETPEQARERRDRQDAASTQEDLAARARAYAASTIEDIVSRVTAPTLVLHPRDYMLLPAAESMKVAARIPGARFAFIEGQQLPGDAESGIRAIDDFLDGIEGLAASFQAGSASAESAHNTPAYAGLSFRQSQVLNLIAQGRTNREIADELVLSERTVQRHVADLYVKINVRNRAEATSYALSLPA
jgi:DNA-binding CsgD family transcriptional regulator